MYCCDPGCNLLLYVYDNRSMCCVTSESYTVSYSVVCVYVTAAEDASVSGPHLQVSDGGTDHHHHHQQLQCSVCITTSSMMITPGPSAATVCNTTTFGVGVQQASAAAAEPPITMSPGDRPVALTDKQASILHENVQLYHR